MQGVGSYLVQLTVTAIENQLKGDICAVLDAADTRGREIDVNAECALAGGLKEGQELLEVAAAVLEQSEVVRVLDSRKNPANYDEGYETITGDLQIKMHVRVHCGCSELRDMNPLEVGNVVRFETEST